MKYEELKKYCSVICEIVGREVIEREKISEKVVREYYSKMAFLYKRLHSKEGAIHFPVKLSDEDNHQQKLLYQAESIQEIINKYDYSDILELGSGMGFNINYLAKQNPDRHFTGLDLTPENIKFARRKSKKLNNACFLQMDYDQLENPNKKYDLIFAVETLCHSKNIISLLKGLGAYLKDHGRIILFDGYVNPDVPALNSEYELEAYKLLSWGFALNGFQKLDDILGSEKLTGLKADYFTDLSKNILPNAEVFQKGSAKILQYPYLLKILLKTGLISRAYIKQIAAGLFGAYFIKMGYLGYYRLEISKGSSSY